VDEPTDLDVRGFFGAVGLELVPGEEIDLRGVGSGQPWTVAATGFRNAALAARAWKAAGRNVFFGVNPRVYGSCPGSKDDVSRVVSLHADVDEPGTTRATVDAALASVGLPRASVVVASGGGGAHVYLRLAQPLVAADAFRAEAANRRLAGLLGGDSCWDVSRILRIPGTTNFPDRKKRALGRVPAPVGWDGEDGGAHDFETVERALAAVPEDRIPRARASGHAEVPDSLRALPAIDPARARILGHAPDRVVPIGQRSGADWALAVKAYARGASDAEVAWLLVNAPWGKILEMAEEHGEGSALGSMGRTMRKAKARAAEIMDVLAGYEPGQEVML